LFVIWLLYFAKNYYEDDATVNRELTHQKVAEMIIEFLAEKLKE